MVLRVMNNLHSKLEKEEEKAPEPPAPPQNKQRREIANGNQGPTKAGAGLGRVAFRVAKRREG